MDQKKILLCCGAGMSSGFLANNARKAAKKNNQDLVIEARSNTEVNEFISSIDVLMIGPHYGAQLKQYEELARPYNVSVLVIPQDIYAQLDGERLINLALEKIKEKGE